MKQVTSV